jgi:Mg2+/Co2+ transporter CorB
VAGVRKMQNGTYLIKGDVTIRDLDREYGWGLPDENYSTLAGLIIHEAQAIPEIGQVFTFYDFRFDIIKRHRNQITQIRVTPPEKKKKVS